MPAQPPTLTDVTADSPPTAAARHVFEAMAGPHAFDLTRRRTVGPEPWAEYAHAETGYLWAGFISGWEAARIFHLTAGAAPQ